MNVENVVASLKYMLFGMVGIFIITGVIIAGIYLLNKLTAATPKDQNK